jgi:hypothetical protein
VVLHAHISSGGWIKGPLVAEVQRHSLTPSSWTTVSTELLLIAVLNSSFKAKLAPWFRF